LLEPAAKALADALGSETHPADRWALAEGLAAVAGGLPPEQRAAFLSPAAKALADALGSETGSGNRQNLAKGLAAVARGLPPDRGTPLLLPHVALSAELKGILSPALVALAPRCSLEESVEALKSPFCCGDVTDLFLRRAEQLTGQTFRTRWELVEWLRKNHPEIDLSASPRLVE
jgi:hypothetical protein